MPAPHTRVDHPAIPEEQLIRRWTSRSQGKPARRQRLRALRAAGALFDRYGGAAVFVGRFVLVGRIAIAWLAGADRFDRRRFALWNAGGSMAWAAIVGGVAYAAGSAGARWLAVAGLVVAVLAIARLWWTSRSVRQDADPTVSRLRRRGRR
jgi:membrane protein DedA with SNARE-associated domain